MMKSLWVNNFAWGGKKDCETALTPVNPNKSSSSLASFTPAHSNFSKVTLNGRLSVTTRFGFSSCSFKKRFLA